jgi:hypothetical protein
MSDPYASQPDPRIVVERLAAKHGVKPPPRTGPLQVLDWGQTLRCRRFLKFKSQEPCDDPDSGAPEVARRAARILLARAGSTLNQTVWGLPEDPEDPETTDFGDVTKVFDRWAERIHSRAAAAVRPSGRHRLA